MAVLYYLEKFNGFLSQSILFLIFQIISLALPIYMIIIGIQNLNECPFNPVIPIWLIIGAGLYFVYLAFNYGLSIVALLQKKRGSWNVKQILLNTYCKFDIYIRILIHIFLIGWSIGGSILAFPNWSSISQDTNSGIYCKQLCFNSLYVTTIITWCYSGLFLSSAIVLLIWGICNPKV